MHALTKRRHSFSSTVSSRFEFLKVIDQSDNLRKDLAVHEEET